MQRRDWKERKAIPLRWYQPKSHEVSRYCASGSTSFSNKEMMAAVFYYSKACDMAAENSTDQAYALRRLASTLYHDHDNDNHLELANKSLINSLKIFGEHLEVPIILLEYQRCLDLLCRIALDRKEGQTLQKYANALFAASNRNTEKHFMLAAHRYLFHVHFAKKYIHRAVMHIQQSIELSKQIGADCNTDYRLLAKVELYRLADITGAKEREESVVSNIRPKFWTCFDARKQAQTQKRLQDNSLNLSLYKDLIFLFKICILTKDHSYIIEYIKNQARNLIPTHFQTKLINKCEALLKQFNQDGKLHLDYQLFPDVEPPAITKAHLCLITTNSDKTKLKDAPAELTHSPSIISHS